MEAKIRVDQQLLAVENDHHVHAMLELNAPPASGSEDRQPLNLASSSIDPDRCMGLSFITRRKPSGSSCSG